MIERISIANEATFNPTAGEVLDDLRQFNYIFGSNGTGKTTISRIIADPAFSTTCHCTWTSGRLLETRVLNPDFVEKNFEQLRGVFTLGEEAKDAEKDILEAKAQLDEENEGLARLKQTLEGDDGNGGKNSELAQVEDDYRDKFWVPVQKIKKNGKLKGAMTGVLNDKQECKAEILEEAKRNTAALKPLADLHKRAETIFGETPTKQPTYPTIDHARLVAHASNEILKKKVIGKEDVDIAAMIKKLGNSDWVRQGLTYYQGNDQVCPFCQQETTEQFAQSLKDYFDKAFEDDTNAINTLVSQYAIDAAAIQSTLDEIIAKPGKFIDVEKMKTEKAALDQTLAANQLRLENKKKGPSRIVTLDSLAAVLTAIRTMIDAANAEITTHNRMVENVEAERKALTADVWRYVLNELDVDLSQYRKKKGDLDKAIDGLGRSIKECESRIARKTTEINDLEKQRTSTQPTINAINATLKQFGFDSFTLADAGDDKHYKLRRANGDDASKTLSEGERTFVVFLYFYHLLQGSFSNTGMTTDRVVVFDDPVSSLDSDVLFIVSSLIREVCENCRKGEGHIKQVFVLTHNVYFHKEVTYERNRDPKCCRNDESFWVVRKGNPYSECVQHKCNPIKTSYQLLWDEVREARRSASDGGTVNPRIENTLRRILEHYFKILGAIDYTKICDRFDGPDKVACNSLFKWLNAGSHSALDDAHITPSDTMTQNALRVFKEIFDKRDHLAHYQMMMGEVDD